MTIPVVLPPRARRVRGRRLLAGLLALLVAIVAFAIAIPMYTCSGPAPKLEDYGVVAPFALTDERGQPFTDADLRGHVTVVSFVFTRCDTICPVTSMKMETVQNETYDAKEKIRLVSFSVDPAYDTPAILAEYAKRYHQNPARWRFVTGTPDAMKSVVEGAFMSSMQRDGNTPSGAPSIAHTGRFMLVDFDGRIRGAYDSNDQLRRDALVRDARYLARKQR